MTDIPALLSERAKTHGDFGKVAQHAQFLRNCWRAFPNWNKFDDAEKEALDMLASKLARLGCGNPHEPDHWKDGSAYLLLPLTDY